MNGDTSRKDINVLVINGSPRQANTDKIAAAALDAAAEAGAGSVAEIQLRKMHIDYCIGCFSCTDNQKGASGCAVYRDSMDEIVPLLIDADAIILASPVYFGGVTAQMKTFMDRTESILRYVPEPRRASLRNKIGAGIVVGGNRNGGQEATLQAMHHFFFIHDMMVVGTGPDRQPGCYLGAAAYSGADPRKGSKVLDAVLSDDLGLRAGAIIGRRVVEAAGFSRDVDS